MAKQRPVSLRAWSAPVHAHARRFLETLAHLAEDAELLPRELNDEQWKTLGSSYAEPFAAWSELRRLALDKQWLELDVRVRSVYPPSSEPIRLGRLGVTGSALEAARHVLGIWFRNLVYQGRADPAETMHRGSTAGFDAFLAHATMKKRVAADWAELSPIAGHHAAEQLRAAHEGDVQSLVVRLDREFLAAFREDTNGEPPAPTPRARVANRSDDALADYQPANYFSKVVQSRLRHASAADRKSKRVRMRREQGTKYYSAADARKLWPHDVPGR